MAKKLALVNGIPKMEDETGAPPIYHEIVEVVSSGATGNQINGPISSGTPVTLPSGQTYSGDELEVRIGDRLNPVRDYTFHSSTQVAFTFELKPGDVISFRIDREA